MTLAVPLTLEQISAADRIYNCVSGWQSVDRSLSALRERFPDFGPEATLLKAVAVNSLYSTNVYAITRVAQHMEHVLRCNPMNSGGPELVEQLARVEWKGRVRRHRSFASKFAHFFIDADRFPIFDRYADEMLRGCLGEVFAATDSESTYIAFVENFHQLAMAVGLDGGTRRLDHYLWIAGQCRAWTANKDARVNSEIRELLERSPVMADIESVLLSLRSI